MRAYRPMLIPTAVCAMLALAAVICPPIPAADKHDVNGRITGLGPNHHALLKVSGQANSSVVTAENGAFHIPSLTPGTYQLTPSHMGYHFVPESRLITVAARDVTGVSFMAHQDAQAKFTISGTIAGLGPNHHATVRTSGKAVRTATTRDDGSYTLQNMERGSYTVRPSHLNYHFNPSFHTAAVTTQDLTSVDFTASPNASQPKGTKKR
jgi:hypothetical protein